MQAEMEDDAGSLLVDVEQIFAAEPEAPVPRAADGAARRMVPGARETQRIMESVYSGRASEAAADELDDVIRQHEPMTEEDVREIEARVREHHARHQQDVATERERLRQDLARRGVTFRPAPGPGELDAEDEGEEAGDPSNVRLLDEQAAQRQRDQHLGMLSQEGFPAQLLRDPMSMIPPTHPMYAYTRQHPLVLGIEDVLGPKMYVPRPRRYPSTEYLIITAFKLGLIARQWRKMPQSPCVCLTFQLLDRDKDLEKEQEEQARQREAVTAARDLDMNTVKLVTDSHRNTFLCDNLRVNLLLRAHTNEPWHSAQPERHCAQLAHFGELAYSSMLERMGMRRDGLMEQPDTAWSWSLLCYFYSYF